MLNTIATTLGVKGNGCTLGLINGTKVYGLISTNTGSVYNLSANDSYYGQFPVGTMSAIGHLPTEIKTMGVTTEAGYSGIVANMPDTIKPTLCIIKY